MDELTDVWGASYPAIVRLWKSASTDFVPFLDHEVEIRTERPGTMDHEVEPGLNSFATTSADRWPSAETY